MPKWFCEVVFYFILFNADVYLSDTGGLGYMRLVLASLSPTILFHKHSRPFDKAEMVHETKNRSSSYTSIFGDI